MGSHGRSDVERQPFGSVTKRVLRVVDVPVLVVRNA
jgi:nucleotide-binding universal stress UspA family protein